MMHPSTRIEFISEEFGCGVFATAPIPKGTLIWAKDSLDQVFNEVQVRQLPEAVREFSLTYMYRNCKGQYVLLWDHGKYINHSFHPNCMPTPYGFDIAIRDIASGEQLTEDYGLLNIIQDFSPLPENNPQDRGVVRGDDLKRFSREWDLNLAEAIKSSYSVNQPLWELLSQETAREVQGASQGKESIRSVVEMRLI